VGRTGCVDVPALPLQIVLRRHPDWRDSPIVVVAEDRPQGLVLCLNEAARRSGIRTGMRYAAALSFAPDLRADTVSPEDVAAGVNVAVERLLRFTPGVEPSAEEPGVFFLDASGLVRLHGSLDAWAAALRRDLAAAGFRSRIAVGFTRFGVYAAAKTVRGAVVFETEADETRAAQCVALERLGIDPSLRGTLEKLGVRTVRDLLGLPEEGLLRRFGGDARRLRQFAAGESGTPLARAVPKEPLEDRDLLEHPETDATRLVFVAKRLVDRLVEKAARRGDAVTGIVLRFALDRHPPFEETLRTAAPTLEPAQILDLVHLRLAAARLPSGVTEVTLTAACVPATKAQIQLFAERPRRDLTAAHRAFARIAAEFGAHAVAVARLSESHLPEASFTWEPLGRLAPPRPRIVSDPPLVRRILAQPAALSPRPRREPNGWLVAGPERGPVVRLSGPWPVSTRWWTAAPADREHCFAETTRGDALWLFRDLATQAWWRQGSLE
jgi:protein ImuB